MFKRNKCNGRYFNVIIYCVDYIFNIFYAINPMILIYINYNGLYSSLFSSKSNNLTLIQYLSIILPLTFLSFMTYFIRKTHQSWRYEIVINPNNDDFNHLSIDDREENENENDQRTDVLTPRNKMNRDELNDVKFELNRFSRKKINDSFND